jgi:translation initiation factor IF-2
MRKVRIYELAKEAGMESKALAEKLIDMGYSIKAYNSTIDEKTASEIRGKLGLIKPAVENKRIQRKGKTTIIRRRVRSKESDAQEEPELDSTPEVSTEVQEEITPEPAVSEVKAEKIEVEVEKPEVIEPKPTVIQENTETTSEVDPDVSQDDAPSIEEVISEPSPPEEKEKKIEIVDTAPAEDDKSEQEKETQAAREAEISDSGQPEEKSAKEEEKIEGKENKEKKELSEQQEKNEEKKKEVTKDEQSSGKEEVDNEPDPKKEHKKAPKKVKNANAGKTPGSNEEKQRARKGLARVIKKAAIVLPVQEKKSPKPKKGKNDSAEYKDRSKKVKPKKVETVQSDEDKSAAGGGKAKKGKRFVKFQQEPSPQRDRNKKAGKRKRRGGSVEMEEIAGLGGRISANMKFGRGHRGPKKKKKEVAVEVAETKAIKKRIKIHESITVGDFAHRMGVKANEIIAKLMGLGVMATLNQSLDIDTATLVAGDFGYEVTQLMTEEQTVVDLDQSESGGEEESRPPVVTVMGHVDHGKTSILDAIRKTDVAAGEAGGITQHIGAHYVRSSIGDVVFLDTPGHAAFTEMRSRGAQVTDVVVLVVAADDGVMEQTKEAINHSKAAGVPLVVAVNKIDKPDADPMRVKRELAEFDLVPEDWGGETIFCEVSAKQNTGIEALLEQILLQAEMLELQANPNRKAKGWVIEAQLHKGRGPVATVLVQHGTLKVGDPFVVGQYSGKVRSLTDDKGKLIKECTPSMPVEVQGLAGVPKAGDEFIVVADEKMAKNVSSQRQQKNREKDLASGTKISLDNLFDKLKEGDIKELKILLRADVQGTLEAFTQATEKLSTDEVKVKILHQGTGTITDSDILLAAASDAIIIGFNVRPSNKVQEFANAEEVDIRYYDVIYHALDDIRKAMVGMLEPVFEERVIGSVEIRETFTVPKIGTIAGSYVTDGKIERNCQVRIIRDGVVVYTGKVSSLRRFKDDAKEVNSGYECGVGIENFNDLKIGDIIEPFVLDELEASL